MMRSRGSSTESREPTNLPSTSMSSLYQPRKASPFRNNPVHTAPCKSASDTVVLYLSFSQHGSVTSRRMTHTGLTVMLRQALENQCPTLYTNKDGDAGRK